ncbi:MAG: peptide ABC transporter substrate-binding protein, partial [Erysipelotrichales bacterium]|nr:peptide ABC transporter substrate-binding protein [Erysipelotrichales bacterium]
MVDQVLKGTDVSNIPVKVFKDNLKIFVNEKTMKELGIELPKNIQDDEALIIMK